MKKLKLLITDLHLIGISYFKCDRFKQTIQNKIFYGDRLTLEKPLTNNQIEYINTFKNTNYSIKGCQYQYAPEIQFDVLYLYDKCIR